MTARAASVAPAGQFTHWLRFLTEAADTPRNHELLSEYFCARFAKSPESLEGFLQFLSMTLQSSRRTEKITLLASQYLSVLSPLCERFGLFAEKDLLDGLCFAITSPAAYREVEKFLVEYQRKSRETIAAVRTVLTNLLREHGHAHELQGRYKSLYGIHRKLQRRKYANPLSLRDIFAFRVILSGNNPDECFEVMNLLHDTFQPVAAHFKDYITIPKINGYQSLHTVLNGVLPDLDLPVEVQIRTAAMHDFAERGFASHWLYARNKEKRVLSDKERKVLLHFLSLTAESESEGSLLCFSPRGDIVKLSPGATAIDFANEVHTELGRRAVAAKINGRPRGIHAPLAEGDRIEIVTSVAKRPKNDSSSAHARA